MTITLTRREFLKGSLAGGFTIAVSTTPLGYSIANAAEKKPAAGFAPNVWVQITPDDTVTIYVGNSEMGQGVLTAQSMVVADELEADWEKIRIRQGEARDGFKNPILHSQITVASGSLRGMYEPLRRAGAAARAMLIQAAAELWDVPQTECKAELGYVTHRPSKQRLSFGNLSEVAAKLPVPQNPPLKSESEFRYIGKTMPRVDVPQKVSGHAVYGTDVQLDGLHYSVLARPPAYGAKPVSFDQKAAEQVKGVVKVVKLPMGIAVCATSTEAALKGRGALNTTWDKGAIPAMDNAYIEKTMMADLDRPGAKVQDTGDAKKALADASLSVEATYFVPFVAHATMEPMNCTAHVTPESCDVWGPIQSQTTSKGVASKISGLPANKVHIHTTMLGCGMGRKAKPDFVAEAVMIAKALGKPVKHLWTREEDIKYDSFRSAVSHRIKAGIDAEGQLTAWSHKLASVSILRGVRPELVKNGIDAYCLWGLWDTPKSPHWNNRIQYEIPNFYIEFKIADLPMPVAPWRSVQNACNAFAIECFMDELAKAAGKDPLEFRLRALKNNLRARRVLETVADKAGWGKPIQQGQGRGIAQHACFGSWVAQVVDLSVDRASGKVKVHRVVAAVDCGPVVNPGPLVEQIESGIMMALSTALKEEVKFADGGVQSANFSDYNLLRMSEAPEVEVYAVNSTEKMGGIGEVGVPPLAPAMANAFYNATGVRVRRLPFTPERVLAALKQA